MDYLLGKQILVLYENNHMSWVELKSVKHENQASFKVVGEQTWYSKQTIVHIPTTEELNNNFCLNCKLPVCGFLLCRKTHCINHYKQETDVGFYTSFKNAKKFRDRRLKYFPTLRENLWSNSEYPEENIHMHFSEMLYCIKHGKYLPKSRFSDRRLSKKNKGKRYNLYAH